MIRQAKIEDAVRIAKINVVGWCYAYNTRILFLKKLFTESF